jgi:hypothetical protein
MQPYEIRLHKRQRPTPAIYRTSQISDFSAIRTARRIADDGDTIEVWKDMECIYADPLQQTWGAISSQDALSGRPLRTSR